MSQNLPAEWVEAAKRTPAEPVVVVEIESGNAVEAVINLKSQWDACTNVTNCDTFDRGDGHGGIRPKLWTYDNTQVTWTAVTGMDRYLVSFTTPAEGHIESASGNFTTGVPDSTLQAVIYF